MYTAFFPLCVRWSLRYSIRYFSTNLVRKTKVEISLLFCKAGRKEDARTMGSLPIYCTNMAAQHYTTMGTVFNIYKTILILLAKLPNCLE